MATNKEIMNDLTRLLATLQTMTPLEPSSKAMDDTEHAAWMQQHQTILGLMKEALTTAKEALPPEIRRLLREVEQAGYRLYSPDESAPLD